MNESEMVERVAMAIARSRHGASLRWEQETGGLRQSALDDARAAIAELREPTEAMVRVGNVVHVYGGTADESWRAMAGEALK